MTSPRHQCTNCEQDITNIPFALCYNLPAKHPTGPSPCEDIIMKPRSRHTAGASTGPILTDHPKPSVPRSILPPEPPELPVIGQAFRLRRDFIRLLREAAAHGDIATVSVNPLTIRLVNHPELNREVLVTHYRTLARGQTSSRVFRWLMGNGVATSNVSDHLAQRRLMQPQFHHRHIENYAQSMTELSAQRAESWTDGAALDLERKMRKLTLRVIVKALFGVDQSDL